jgi:DNA-binding XRE family transcriptional regulator
MFKPASREHRATLMGHNIDKIFRDLGIDPNLASLSAFEAAHFPVKQFPEQMVIRRVNYGLGRQELAARLGWNAETLLRWETGRTSPSIVGATAWAGALGLELGLVLTGPGRPQALAPSPQAPRP